MMTIRRTRAEECLRLPIRNPHYDPLTTLGVHYDNIQHTKNDADDGVRDRIYC
jgi:hypothetical protein